MRSDRSEPRPLDEDPASLRSEHAPLPPKPAPIGAGAAEPTGAIAAPAVEPAGAPASDAGPAAASRFFKGFLRDLAFFVALFLFIYHFVMNVSVVRGKSMEPTFYDGDRLIVDKLTYRLGNITEANRFDVVVLKNPRDPTEDYIKRLVGFPGETIELRNGRLYIDGCRYAFDGAIPDRDNFRTKVRPGHYFVLGDNRARSNDSRFFEGVPRDYIKGKIRMRFWPPEKFRVFGTRQPVIASSDEEDEPFEPRRRRRGSIVSADDR